MSILKADLLTFCNNALEREESSIDTEINRALFKISNSNNFLAAIKTTDTIDTTTTSLSYPDNFKQLDNIRLYDNDNGTYTDYLDKISYNEFLAAQHFNNRSTPVQYAIFNRTIYFFPLPSKEFYVHISYFKLHPADADNIEFEDTFLNVLQSGCTTEVAYKYGLTQQIQIWGSRYVDDLKDVSHLALSPTYNNTFKRW